MDWYNSLCERGGEAPPPKQAQPAEAADGAGIRLVRYKNAQDGSVQAIPPEESSCRPFTGQATLKKLTTYGELGGAQSPCRQVSAQVTETSVAVVISCGAQDGSRDVMSATLNPDGTVDRAFGQQGRNGEFSLTGIEFYEPCTAEKPVDCSPEGQAAMYAESPGKGANYVCPNPLPPSAFR